VCQVTPINAENKSDLDKIKENRNKVGIALLNITEATASCENM
jgi:hypothetical protein